MTAPGDRPLCNHRRCRVRFSAVHAPHAFSSNGVKFEHEIVIPPKRTAMCLFVDDDGDGVHAVPSEGNDEVSIKDGRDIEVGVSSEPSHAQGL